MMISQYLKYKKIKNTHIVIFFKMVSISEPTPPKTL